MHVQEHRHHQHRERSPDPRGPSRQEDFPLPNGDQAGPSSSAAGGGQWAAMYGAVAEPLAPKTSLLFQVPLNLMSCKARAQGICQAFSSRLWAIEALALHCEIL